MRLVVGMSQKIKRAWIDATLDRVVRTTDEADLRSFLDHYLKADLPSKVSRAKAAGILLRIWSGIPAERVSLRDRALAMLPHIPGEERIWLHWGMAALAYPFFRDTAEVIGRLLALQDDFTTNQVQARMLTTWGDRNTSKEAVQKLITTLVDWEVLRSTKTKGHFLLTRQMTASRPDVQLWLLEALLAASAADEIEAQQLLRLPESFPFALSIGIADLRRHDGFNIHRQGLDMDMVALRKVKLEPPPSKSRTRHQRKGAEAETGPGSGASSGRNGTGRGGRTPAAFRRFHGSVRLNPQRLGRDASQIAEDVVQQLLGIVGADVEVTLEIRAELPDASEELVRDVTENCRTLKFDGYGFEEA